MQKAKIMLVAIVIIAVIGGALAFKAYGIYNVFCATKINGVITCTTTNYKTTPDLISTTLPCLTWHQAIFGPGAPTTSSYYTTSLNCPPPVHSTVYWTNVP